MQTRSVMLHYWISIIVTLTCKQDFDVVVHRGGADFNRFYASQHLGSLICKNAPYFIN